MEARKEGSKIMTEYPHHKSLHLENFTAFSQADFEFVPGVNVFVGENGTGKTHVMKAMYALELSRAPSRDEFYKILLNTFQLKEDNDGTRRFDLLRRQGIGEDEITTFHLQHGKDILSFQILSGLFQDAMRLIPNRPVFIPAIDMMGHSKGFTEAYDEILLDFDLTCRDIVNLLRLERREKQEPSEAFFALKRLLKGDIEKDSEGRFYLVTPVGRLPMQLVGEGLRKVATLVQLQKNGWLVPGTTLFWDEPEVNLNPKWMDEVVAAILALSRSGVQVFLATHSYVILKELEVQAQKSDSYRFFAFTKSEQGTTIKPADSYLELSPNPIEDHYADLYDRGIEKRLQRGEPIHKS